MRPEGLGGSMMGSQGARTGSACCGSRLGGMIRACIRVTLMITNWFWEMIGNFCEPEVKFPGRSR